MSDDIATIQYIQRGEYVTVKGRPLGAQRLTSPAFGNIPAWFLLFEDANRIVRRIPLVSIQWFQEGADAAPEAPHDPDDFRRCATLRAYRDALGLTNAELAATLQRLAPDEKSSTHTVACWMAHRDARKARKCPQWPLDTLIEAYPDRLGRVKPAALPDEVPSAGKPPSSH